MSDVSATYALPTGEAAVALLGMNEKVYGPDCRRILTELGVKPGMRVADIGCGTGNAALWFAGEVGDGEVIALDVSALQLATARAAAEAAGHHNVRFVEASAYDPGLPNGSFDIVHCRLLLCHLDRPLDALRSMARLAKPGGLVICFDVDMTALATSPVRDCYVELRDAMIQNGRKLGLDYQRGIKLPGLFTAAGLTHPNMAVISPVYLRGEEKRLWERQFLAAAPERIKAGLIEESTVTRLAAELAAVAADDSVAVFHSAMPVCWARKSEGSIQNRGG